MRLSLALAAAFLLALPAAPVRGAQSTPHAPTREAGLLTCNVDQSFGVIFGSTLRLNCTFEAGDGQRAREHYVAHMDRGSGGRVAAGQIFSWKVWTPGGEVRDGMLTGAFVNAVSEKPKAADGEETALFNGQSKCIALKPAELSSQGVLNPAFSAVALDLRSARRGGY